MAICVFETVKNYGFYQQRRNSAIISRIEQRFFFFNLYQKTSGLIFPTVLRIFQNLKRRMNQREKQELQLESKQIRLRFEKQRFRFRIEYFVLLPRIYYSILIIYIISKQMSCVWEFGLVFTRFCRQYTLLCFVGELARIALVVPMKLKRCVRAV